VNKEILEIIRSKRPNEIYNLVNLFIQDLNLFDSSFDDSNQLIKNLKEFPEKHTDAYSEKQAGQVFDITEESNKISNPINDIKARSFYLIEKYDKSKKEMPINYTYLRIGTDQDIPLIEDFIV